MRRIGLLVGDETALRATLEESWHHQGEGGRNGQHSAIEWGLVEIGGTTERHISRYDVIVDRFSWAVPHYGAYVRSAALAGCRVINDPTLGYDDFSALSMAAHKGFNVARTCLLPQKHYEQIDTQRCLHNLQYPLDWGTISNYVRFPAQLRHLDGHSRSIANVDQLMRGFDESHGVVVLQEQIEAPHVRVLCVGTTAIPLGSCPDHVANLAVEVTAALGLSMGQVDVALCDPPKIVWCFQRHVPLDPTKIGEAPFTSAIAALTALCAQLAYG